MNLIQLIHPEYQINSNNVGRKVLANVKMCNKVGEEQHRSRKYYQAWSLLLNKMVGDFFCLIRFSGYYVMNNAKWCYDKIDHNFAILVLIHSSLLWFVAKNLFRVLQQARHWFKTDYGVTQPVYGNKDVAEHIAGIGQGIRLDPSLWCLISILIIDTCKRKSHRTTSTTPISKKEVSLIGFAFVDNADLVTTANNAYISRLKVIQKMLTLMTERCGCFCATGGLVAPVKTRWFLVSFFLDGTDWEYRIKGSLTGDITLPDKDNNLHTVSKEEPTTALESLGLHIHLVNTLSNAMDDIAHIYHEFSIQIKNLKCTKIYCLNTFNTSFMPTLSYRMIVTQFIEQP